MLKSIKHWKDTFNKLGSRSIPHPRPRRTVPQNLQPNVLLKISERDSLASISLLSLSLPLGCWAGSPASPDVQSTHALLPDCFVNPGNCIRTLHSLASQRSHSFVQGEGSKFAKCDFHRLMQTQCSGPGASRWDSSGVSPPRRLP